jgi:hypothetical protein
MVRERKMYGETWEKTVYAYRPNERRRDTGGNRIRIVR